MDNHPIITSRILTCGTSEISLLLIKAFSSDGFDDYLTINNVATQRRKENGGQNNNWSKSEYEIMVRRKGCYAWNLDRIYNNIKIMSTLGLPFNSQ